MRSLAVLLALLCLALPARADLGSYIKKAEPKYTWKLKQKTEVLIGTVYELSLTSQEWQGITWEHDLAIVLPKDVKPTATMILWNQGGTFKITDAALILSLASKTNSPVAFLYGVPKQPLFDGLKEDALISETFVRYMKTKDEDWPLLFPMVKSVVKAMDAVQEFAKKEWNHEVKGFVVTGASKRGWTSWLTAASGDPRVKAISPLVIDMLNFSKQIPLQIESFGKPSEQIRDYTEKGLLDVLTNPVGKKLWEMMDPWMYREKVTVPKMLIHGTNDPYWPQDATNVYWDDLKGEKYLLYVPNAGHNLQQKSEGNPRDLTRVVSTLSAFGRSEIYNRPMPKMTWKHDTGTDGYILSAESKPAAKKARLWAAENGTKDFRQSTWKETAVAVKDGKVEVSVPGPKEGFKTFFVELEFEDEGQAFFLSTQLRMVKAK